MVAGLIVLAVVPLPGCSSGVLGAGAGTGAGAGDLCWPQMPPLVCFVAEPERGWGQPTGGALIELVGGVSLVSGGEPVASKSGWRGCRWRFAGSVVSWCHLLAGLAEARQPTARSGPSVSAGMLPARLCHGAGWLVVRVSVSVVTAGGRHRPPVEWGGGGSVVPLDVIRAGRAGAHPRKR